MINFTDIISRKIFHPNVVLFLGASTAEKHLMIVTELMETDLEKLLQSKQEISFVRKLALAKDAVRSCLSFCNMIIRPWESIGCMELIPSFTEI